MKELADLEANLEKRSVNLLKNRGYLSLLAAQLVSNIGDWLSVLALLTLVGLKWNATPWEITGVTLCMLLPTLLGGPLAGLVADRMERKKLMILSDIVRVFLVVGMIFAGQLWQMYLLLIAKGAFDTLFSPAKSGKIKEIIPHDQLDQAVAYSSIIEQGTKILGPALGGMLTAFFGIKACFVIDAGSFLVSAILLLGVPARGRKGAIEREEEQAKGASEPKESFWQGISEGLSVIARLPVIAYGLAALTAGMLVLQIADSQSIVLFRDLPGVPQNLLGICIALSGAGTLVSAVLVSPLKRLSPLAKMGMGGVLVGLVFAGAGVLAQQGPYNMLGYFLMGCIFFCAGIGAGMTFIPFQVELQRQTPERFTGRVFGTVSSLTSTAALIGPVIGGFFVSSFGASSAFMIAGVLMACVGSILLFFKNFILKRQERMDSAFEGEKAVQGSL